MQWSPLQDKALVAVDDWLQKRDNPVFRLFGYAGTGKTTLAKEFAAGVSGEVMFAAYTGKAASVLRKRGCPGASTIHQLIYKPKDKSQLKLKELEQELAEVIRELRLDDVEQDQIELHSVVIKLREQIAAEQKSLRRPAFELNPDSPLRFASLLIVDECSMVDERVGQDIMSFEVPVLVLGDPAQLPPVFGGGFFTEHKPDVMLTEIHRQARDNPIIQMASAIRQGEFLAFGNYGNSQVVRWHDVNAQMVREHDQLLVGTNKFRRDTNRRMRELIGFEGAYPVAGDKLVCLRNNHDLGLLNGTIWNVMDSITTDSVSLSIKSEDDGTELATDAHLHYFEGGEPPYWEIKDRDCFDYGYALTVHKSQGSQWNNVLVFDESYAFRDSSRRWLYTAVTRAAERLTIARK